LQFLKVIQYTSAAMYKHIIHNAGNHLRSLICLRKRKEISIAGIKNTFL